MGKIDMANEKADRLELSDPESADVDDLVNQVVALIESDFDDGHGGRRSPSEYNLTLRRYSKKC